MSTRWDCFGGEVFYVDEEPGDPMKIGPNYFEGRVVYVSRDGQRTIGAWLDGEGGPGWKVWVSAIHSENPATDVLRFSVDPIKKRNKLDGRYFSHTVVKSYHRFFGPITDTAGVLTYLAKQAVAQVCQGMRCCVKHMLIGHYDGTECCGLAPSASEPETSVAAADPAS